MDLSKLSDTDFQAIQHGDLTKLSDEGLKFVQSQPGNSKENPLPVDMFGQRSGESFGNGDLTRIGVGFGDNANAQKAASKAGFKNTSLDPEGNVTGQDQQGHFVKDATNFFPSQWSGNKPVTDLNSAGNAAADILKSAHPINWAESNLGRVLPNAGMMAGGVYGGEYGGLPGALGGSSALATAGEYARQQLGRLGGVYNAPADSSESISNDTAAAKNAVLAELTGKALGVAGKAPLPDAGFNWTNANTVGELLKKGISRVASIPSYIAMGTSIPWEDVSKVIEHPQGVSAASDRGYGLDTASKLEAELRGSVGKAGENVSSAQANFRKNFGTQTPDMTDGLNNAFDFLDKHAPNSLGDSRIDPAEYDELLKETQRMGMGDADTLLTQRQRLGESLPGKAYEGSVSQRGDATVGQLKSMGGDISDALHKLDPNGLAPADAAFSKTMGQAATLRPVEGEGQESVVNGIWGKNQTARQQAAEQLAPNTYNSNLLDLRAKQAFDAQGLLGATPKDAITKATVGTLLGERLSNHGMRSPETVAMIAAMIAAQSPKLNYYGLQGLGRTLQRAPQLGVFNSLPNNPWSLMNNQEQK